MRLLMRVSQLGHAGSSSFSPPKTCSPTMENTSQNSMSSTTMAAKESMLLISTWGRGHAGKQAVRRPRTCPTAMTRAVRLDAGGAPRHSAVQQVAPRLPTLCTRHSPRRCAGGSRGSGTCARCAARGTTSGCAGSAATCWPGGWVRERASTMRRRGEATKPHDSSCSPERSKAAAVGQPHLQQAACVEGRWREPRRLLIGLPLRQGSA
jgi:hypothetical protein